jgi:hypothetical protein
MARSKKLKPPNSSHSPTSPSLALSSLHLRLQALEEEHQWLLKQIARKRAELKKFLDQMRSLATEIFHRGQPLYQKLIDLDREIHALFDEILTARKWGRQRKKDILGIYQTLQFTGVISPKLEDGDEELDELFGEEGQEGSEEEFSEEFFSGGSSYHRHDYGVGVSPESSTKSPESRQIRRTFLRMAEIFHPDKVTDPETQMRHNEIMKEVNRAYKEGDIARLLEIERQHQMGDSLEVNGSSESDLNRQCEKIESNNQLLKKQYESLKRELRLVRNTPEGEMVKDYRACEREGIDPIEEMLEEVESQVQTTENIYNFVRDFRDKKITIKEFLRGPGGKMASSSEGMEEIFDQLLAELQRIMRF